MDNGLSMTFEAADSREAQQCLRAYYAELNARFAGGFALDKAPSPDMAAMTPPRGAFVIARLAGHAVACGALTTLAPGIGEIKRVWVSPQARGRGVASRLMDALEARASSLGLRTLRLDTNRALAEAHGMYLRRGYRPIAAYNDNPYADHWFERHLEEQPGP